MAYKTITENPNTSDTVVIPIETPDASGCFPADPYKVDSVTVYFVERDYSDNAKVYAKVSVDAAADAAATAAEKNACASPTGDNLLQAARLRAQASATRTSSPVYFTRGLPVKVFGNPFDPAWLSSDAGNALIAPVPLDANGATQHGHFLVEWSPTGAREGDYFVCWTWTPMPAGASLSAHKSFFLAGNTATTTSIPSHFTVPGKYETLLERYLPEMFKTKIAPTDLSPTVLDQLNRAIAAGFTDLENLANQVIDLQDANSVNESLIPYLSNVFDLRLKSGDPTLWRRQVKRAIPLYKKKGTLGGLREAMELAGMKLLKLTRLWQVASKYAWTDMAVTAEGQTSFTLSRVPLAGTTSVKIRRAGTPDFVTISSGLFSVESPGCEASVVLWDDDSSRAGDALLFTYRYRLPPTDTTVEDYVAGLPLMDLRDPLAQAYPPKNWNVRVIEEDDPMFDLVVPQRHPFHDPVRFGFVRTEFPYSENIYNMEEYNGSTRETTDPCQVDRDYIEDCGDCQGSHFTVDLEILELSNDKILEARDVVRENVPFHAVLHSVVTTGGVEDVVPPPVETVESLVMYNLTEPLFSGDIGRYFNRYNDSIPASPADLKRDMLASMTTVVSNASGVAYNDAVCLYTPDAPFSVLRLSGDNLLEVFAPSANAGRYAVNVVGKTIEVSGVHEPADQAAFTFRLSNVQYATVGSVTPTPQFLFDDPSVQFSELGARSEWDVANDPLYTGGAWTIEVGGGVRPVSDIRGGEGFLINATSGLPSSSTSGLPYTVRDDDGVVRGTGTGDLSVFRLAKVSLPGVTLSDVREMVATGDYAEVAGSQYEVASFDSDGGLFVRDYTGGGLGGATVTVYRRRVDNAQGYFQYSGLKLNAVSDLEGTLGVTNGANPPPDPVLEDNHFKENFIVRIGSDYYKIEAIDAQTVTLGGPYRNWNTAGAGGTAVTYSVLKFAKQQYLVPGGNFDLAPDGDNYLSSQDFFEFVDRRGGEEIDNLTLLNTSMSMHSGLGIVLNESPESFRDVLSQNDTVSLSIKYRDKPKEGESE